MLKSERVAVAAMMTALTACSVGERDNAAEAQPAAVAGSEAGVTREAIAAPTPSPTPTPQAALQTQPGPKGSQVALNRVAVTGDIMTVALTYAGGTCCIYTKLDQVSAIDDATSQRISVLKDNAGAWMAAPVYGDGKELRIDPTNGAQVWFKFPAPPATSATVSIAIPDVAPFDAVPVTR